MGSSKAFRSGHFKGGFFERRWVFFFAPCVCDGRWPSCGAAKGPIWVARRICDLAPLRSASVAIRFFLHGVAIVSTPRCPTRYPRRRSILYPQKGEGSVFFEPRKFGCFNFFSRSRSRNTSSFRFARKEVLGGSVTSRFFYHVCEATQVSGNRPKLDVTA